MKFNNKVLISLTLALVLAFSLLSVSFADSVYDTDDIVIDAIDYTREIIPVYEGSDYSDYEHEICIPKLNLDTENAKKFNEKIYNDHAMPYETLLDYSEEEWVYNVDYDSENYDGIVGIIVTFSGGPQASEMMSRYLCYYYDVNNDTELTFEEYAAKFGYDTYTLTSKLESLEAHDGYSHECLGDMPVLDGFIADDDETIVVFSNVETPDETVIYEVDSIIAPGYRVADVHEADSAAAAPVIIENASESNSDSNSGSNSDSCADIGKTPKVIDNSGLLTATERDALESKLENFVAEYGLDAVILTADSLDGKTAEAYADDYYDYNYYGVDDEKSGILLLVSIGERDYAISTTGKGLYVFTNRVCENMVDEFIDDLSAGNYYDAFDTFARLCDHYAFLYTDEDSYDDYEYSSEPFPLSGIFIFGALLIGFIVALIAVGIMKGKLKSVRAQRAADNYVVDGSLNVTNSSELFLYRTVTRTARPRDEDNGGGGSHTGSSGTSHGGTSGKF